MNEQKLNPGKVRYTSDPSVAKMKLIFYFLIAVVTGGVIGYIENKGLFFTVNLALAMGGIFYLVFWFFDLKTRCLAFELKDDGLEVVRDRESITFLWHSIERAEYFTHNAHPYLKLHVKMPSDKVKQHLFSMLGLDESGHKPMTEAVSSHLGQKVESTSEYNIGYYRKPGDRLEQKKFYRVMRVFGAISVAMFAYEKWPLIETYVTSLFW